MTRRLLILRSVNCFAQSPGRPPHGFRGENIDLTTQSRSWIASSRGALLAMTAKDDNPSLRGLRGEAEAERSNPIVIAHANKLPQRTELL
jgi:hypothetical protein